MKNHSYPLFFSLHAMQGLRAIGIIAASSRQQPVPTTRLARHIGLCLSSTEIIVKQLKNGGLIRSYRGPGGGYQLQHLVKDLSVWDVVSCFEGSDMPPKAGYVSPESEAAMDLAIQLDETICKYLQACRLIDVLERFPADANDHADTNASHTAFHLKPLRQPGTPLAPSWVFDLAKFTLPAHA